MPLDIFQATINNVVSLQRIFENTWENDYSGHYTLGLVEAVLKFDNTAAAWERELNKTDGRLFLAQVNGEHVGLAGLCGTEVGRVGVLSSSRGTGAGRSLMEHIFSEARAAGHKIVWCDASLQAINFYRHLGFETIKAIEKTVYGHPMPMETMVRVL